jgi:hypothetical protein
MENDWDLMVIDGDSFGFNGTLMGCSWDFLVINRDLIDLTSKPLGYKWELPCGND